MKPRTREVKPLLVSLKYRQSLQAAGLLLIEARDCMGIDGICLWLLFALLFYINKSRMSFYRLVNVIYVLSFVV